MSVFDQRHQQVNYQYNAAGDINFGAVQNKMDVVDQLEKLHVELIKAIKAGVFKEDIATDVDYQVKKSIQQAKNSAPDTKTILEHLSEAKALIEGIAAAGGLVTALVQAAEVVQKFF